MLKTKYPIYHRDECGEIGMLTTIEDPQIGVPLLLLLSSEFFHIDGTECYPMEQPTCGHCGKPMAMRIKWIDYDNPLQSQTD